VESGGIKETLCLTKSKTEIILPAQNFSLTQSGDTAWAGTSSPEFS
jgi:hypothetical protein